MARSLAPLPANSQGPTSGWTRPGGREISLPASLACLPPAEVHKQPPGTHILGDAPTRRTPPNPPVQTPTPRLPPLPPLANHPEDSR